jgi:trans-aconitate 2-methyltransferase
LTSRIGADAPRHVVDVECGPGSLAGLLASRWPQAVIEGIDSSPEMIAAAADVPRLSFAVGDAADWQPAGDVDVVVSNAALQWVPRHQELMAKWASALPSGGWLAVQVPGNFDSMSHALMRALADSVRWRRRCMPWRPTPMPWARRSPMRRCCWTPGWWPTSGRRRTCICCRGGPGVGVAARRGSATAAGGPAATRRSFGAELRHAYPPGPHGTVFPVPRVFAVGHKP